MDSVTVAWEDVFSVVQQVSGYLIALWVALAAAIAVIVVSSLKLKTSLKGLVNGEALIAFGLAAVLIVNLMLSGPLYNTLNVVLTDSGELTQEHADASRALVEELTAGWTVSWTPPSGRATPSTPTAPTGRVPSTPTSSILPTAAITLISSTASTTWS